MAATSFGYALVGAALLGLAACDVASHAAADTPALASTPLDKLTAASGYGDTATMRSELGRGLKVNGWNFAGMTPLSLAANSCRADSVKMLLAAGANPNEPDKGPGANAGRTPLLSAIGGTADGCPQVVSALLAAGANPNATERTGATALDIAALEGQTDVAQMLITAGADVNGGPNGLTPLSYTQGDPMGWASRQGRAQVASMLLQHGAHD